MSGVGGLSIVPKGRGKRWVPWGIKMNNCASNPDTSVHGCFEI
jgi:hypothetical protein